MKRFHQLASAVLGKVSLRLLSRAFCGLLLIVGIVAPGAAQSIFVTNTAGIEPAQVSKFSPTGTAINYSFLTFYNDSVPAVAYYGGYIYVAVNNTIGKYNASTAAQDSTFAFAGTGSVIGVAVSGNLLFATDGVSWVGVYNATTGAAIKTQLAAINFPEFAAAALDGQGNVDVYVTSWGVGGSKSGSVQKLSVSSTGVLQSGPTALVGTLNYPQGIALSENGQTVYWVIPSTYSNNALGEVDSYDITTGVLTAPMTNLSNMPGEPWDIACNGPDLLITVQYLDAVDEYTIATQQYNPNFIGGQLNFPRGIAVGGWVYNPYGFPAHAMPYGALFMGAKATSWGTTTNGGSNNVGSVFRMASDGKLTTLHNFDTKDGANPYAGLTQASNGEFYGTTLKGGAYNAGTVFAMSSSGALKTLHSFSGTDGSNPYAGLLQGSSGSFYGTTLKGGANKVGTVFEITPGGELTTLHSFSGTDGASPYAGLVQGANGNLYGTTYGGGSNNGGTVFQIDTSGELTALYNFCSQNNCTDGTSPAAGLAQGTDGNFYGTTYGGGANNGGTVFQLTSNGTLTTLYSFCAQGGSSCVDGQYPSAALVQGNDGNLYGTTSAGGANALGTIFNITPSGKLTTFYTFDGTAGANPEGALIQNFDGTFYGTAAAGGAKNGGTIFNLSAGLLPFVETSPTSGRAGTAVKIVGAGLTGATSVTFNGTPAKFKVVSSYEITTTVPKGATTGPVQVITPNAMFLSNVPFQVPNGGCVGGGSVTIYSNLGSTKDAFDYTDGWLVSGPSSPLGFQQWLGYPFTPTENHNATEIEAAAFYYSGDGQAGNTFNFGIWSDSNGAPGTELNGTDVSNLPAWTGTSGDCCNTQNAAIPSTPLTAGTQYWVVLSTDGSGTNSLGIWDYVYNDASGAMAYNQGAGWSTQQATTSAFAVCGSS